MRQLTNGLAALLLACLAAGPAAVPEAAAQGQAQTPFRPVATVNESIITAWDVDQRARMLIALGMRSADDRQVGNVALERLIENRLMLQEGQRLGVTPTEEMVRVGLNEFAARSEMSPEEFLSRMRETGVTDQALSDVIGAQMVWREVVQNRFRNRIEPGEAEIDAEISLADGGEDRAFRIREIGLQVGGASGRSEAETQVLAQRIYDNLIQGGDFEEAVREYSQAPSAGQAGDVGWVPASALPPALTRELAALDPGQITPPVAVPGGISILRLEGVRDQGGGGLDPADPELRERVRRELVNRRIELLAEGLLQELRRDALIELR